MGTSFTSKLNEEEFVGFGNLAGSVNDILQEGVFLYRHDHPAADARFRDALAADPSSLAAYLCLCKIYTYQGRLDEGLAAARSGLAEAARQAGLDTVWTRWRVEDLAAATQAPAHFALYSLKAIAFILLRRGEAAAAASCLEKLEGLGRLDSVGGSVVAELVRGVA